MSAVMTTPAAGRDAGPAALAKIRRAVDEAQHGLGVALLKGFPREGFTALHSRTQFQDDSEPEKKRLLFRLWLATPDSPRLPAGWTGFYESTEPGVVRGGAYGQNYDDACRRFDAEQAEAMGMRLGPGFSN